MRMDEFKKYYKLPLKLDNCGVYVYTNDNKMAFTNVTTVLAANDLVNAINGVSEGKYKASANDGFITVDGKNVLLARGWGMLTGKGANNLEPHKAAYIQDQFINYCINQLRRNL